VRRTYGCRSFRDTISASILCGRRPDPISGHDSRHQDARRDPAHAGPHDEGRSVLKDRFLPVWRETGQTFSTQERAALERAETLTLISETHAPEEIYRDIAAHFTEKEIVDLTIAIGLMNVFNRIAIGFGCDPASS
jgi:hypothetical protein